MSTLSPIKSASRKAIIDLEDGLKVEIIFLKGKLYPMEESTAGFCLWESSKVACFYDIEKKVVVKNHFVSYNNELFKVECGKKSRKTILMKILFSDDWLRKNKIYTVVFESKHISLADSFPLFFQTVSRNIYKLLHTTDFESIKHSLSIKSYLFNHINSIVEILNNPKYLNGDEIKIKWVIDNFFKPFESVMPTIPDIADKLSMSESKFKRIFKRKIGVSFYHFYLRKSMEQAEHWLLYENLSVKDISYNLGYSQPVSFINQFKKTFGYPPLQYKTKRCGLPAFNN
ncbi:helix-turn-helix domain-containing protein [Runella slithyformis]|uniref:Transcriptional regulator, AraC family n=1 Tax=Runella slithyformis (strain ATCC 29530 / DSM 19594 / LMG 11500 / NCIMB 11436 / LSU 4) TaxID=761193 RepID=A0A7U4E6F7_RUNSL|nr:AraC family transcriptional regulator [Runella slithyformis]AEI49503.1 transcriptional regulator, AraC family [Runella slithyformis DSM 19594]